LLLKSKFSKVEANLALKMKNKNLKQICFRFLNLKQIFFTFSNTEAFLLQKSKIQKLEKICYNFRNFKS